VFFLTLFFFFFLRNLYVLCFIPPAAIHSRLNHPNIVSLVGAGWTSKKVRFIVLERLDGGTLTQMLGYDTRIRDRRRRFWRKKQLPYLDVLRCARSLACSMQYCNEQAVPGSMVLHRDLKPDNIGFSLDGKVKLIDFGLARTMENSDPKSNDVYEMSGETGSLRYMAPEVAEGLPYNHKADVYSFGIIFWEMNAGKRPFPGLSRDTFYEQVVHGGHRPHLNKKWPSELNKLVEDCWSADVERRPTFGQIVDRIDDLLTNEKGGKSSATKVGGKTLQRLTGIIDRHSTWF
jgi:serine/threonine protein kinase